MSYQTYKITYISKEVLKALLLAGAIYIAASSSSFVMKACRVLLREKIVHKQKSKKKKMLNAFDYLQRKGFIEIDQEAYRVRVSLTEKGKKQAGKYQINDLKLQRPLQWDGKWRLIIFDIPHSLRLKHGAFREKLKDLGLYYLQRSVWACPHECRKEIDLLREFFGLDKQYIRIVVADSIEGDRELRKFFKL